MQSFVEQQIRLAGQILPGGEGARHLVERHCLVEAVQIAPVLAGAALAILLEKGLQQTEVVGLRAEVADMPPCSRALRIATSISGLV